MFAWLSRYWGAEEKKETQPKTASKMVVPVTNSVRHPNQPPPLTKPTVAAIHRFGVRRPLIGRNGTMAGFEFRLARNLENRLQSRPNVSVQAAYAVTLLSSMQSTLKAGRLAISTVSAEVLLRPQMLEHVPAGVHVLVHPWNCNEPDAPARLAALRAKGVLIGRVAPAIPQNEPVDFVQISLQADRPAAFWAQLALWRNAQPALALLAMGLDSIDDLERSLQLGVALAGGQVDRGSFAQHKEKTALQANTLRLCQLLNDVVLDRDTGAMAQDIRADVALSYKLLRYVNSPAAGLTRSIESVEKAVMVLGRNELYRCLSVVLLASTEERVTSKALQEMALARARLLEGLAEQRADAVNHPPAALFTVGLLSLLDVMLQLPLAQVLEPLRLSDTARQALLDRSGPWAPYIELAADLERHDMAAASKHAAEFGGMPAILALSDAAWVWAAQASEETAAR